MNTPPTYFFINFVSVLLVNRLLTDFKHLIIGSVHISEEKYSCSVIMITRQESRLVPSLGGIKGLNAIHGYHMAYTCRE